MKIIGLTGNIASGKSTVLRMLRERGAETLDADKVVHALFAPGTPVTQAIAATFGEDVLNADGSVNRKALGARVFSDPDALRRLEAIVHPAVGRAIEEAIAEARRRPNPPPAFVIEAVKLVETGRYRLADSLWLVVADPEVQLQRLMNDRGLSREEALARLQAQPPLEEKHLLADVIIENNGSLEDLRRQVETAWQHLMQTPNKEGNTEQCDAFGTNTPT